VELERRNQVQNVHRRLEFLGFGFVFDESGSYAEVSLGLTELNEVLMDGLVAVDLEEGGLGDGVLLFDQRVDVVVGAGVHGVVDGGHAGVLVRIADGHVRLLALARHVGVAVDAVAAGDVRYGLSLDAVEDVDVVGHWENVTQSARAFFVRASHKSEGFASVFVLAQSLAGTDTADNRVGDGVMVVCARCILVADDVFLDGGEGERGVSNLEKRSVLGVFGVSDFIKFSIIITDHADFLSLVGTSVGKRDCEGETEEGSEKDLTSVY
jgi:hypothetical protein